MNKYNARKAEYNGIQFDSKKEMERYVDLSSNPNVTNLQRQVKYELIPKNDLYRAVTYVADFVYMSGDSKVVEDVKGMVLDVFKLKQKMFYTKYGIPISIWPPKTPKKRKKK